MNNIRNITVGEKRLLGAFGVLIFLIIVIGLMGILQIQGLSRRIESLGKRNIKLESAVLEMKINNTIYAMGIRNYIFWRSSRYLGAVPMAVNLDNISSAARNFRGQLKIYEDSAYSNQQRDWAKQLGASFRELTDLGQQILELVDKMKPLGLEGAINNLLMAFENRLYRIDDFLDNTMGKDSLAEIENQVEVAKAQRALAVLFLWVTLISAVVIGVLMGLSVYRQRRRERFYRHELLSRMINIEEHERKNLSLQVHDQMGQDLSALKIYLGLIEQNLENPPQEAKSKIEDSRKIISGLIEKSHNIAFLLRPPIIDEMGLLASIDALVLDYRQFTGINYTFHKPDAEINLSPEHNLLIYRLTQELLTNTLKHSKAKNVEIRLKKTRDNVEFFYQDDGAGFDYNSFLGQPRRRNEDKLKIGLLGLRERVELFDGEMTIDAKPNRGTRVVVELPI